jgi:predicted HTH transcriptional regulator
MINIELEKVQESDLLILVNNGTIESKSLEFKKELTMDREEFLADISSFANASGGDIIYGMSEDRATGKPKPLDGLDVENIDQEILTLENLIRDLIKPRIVPGVSFRSVPLKNTKVALVVRVPRSINGPHGVYYRGNKHGKFYTRSSNGKHPMDVGELRNAFNLSETIIDRIRNFRMDRVGKIIADETPVHLVNNPKVTLHLLPENSFSLSQK